MKYFQLALIAVFQLVAVSVFAHEKVDSFKVSGNCGMCKHRIEKAARISGVKEVEWNDETKIMQVTFNADVVSLEDIQRKVASVGHDTDKFRADDAVYKKLPGCCRYERKSVETKG
ncbi:heavy-metal-associated domain-containing protein [Flaviaesturariibacter amylovorans]|uniref:HMA domain-containing protein n=1 Tax=Flaviaesturariibacter amylovorans TaxID=1084520 RepID=A0ABP8HL40_9BACT